jgi:XRE family transcriptional regulator, aerobic/anaerobic benzoate catabolism transcriptional regulator
MMGHDQSDLLGTRVDNVAVAQPAANSRAEPPANLPRITDKAFLVELGQRVRHMRALRGMSRKTLTKASGVSERYIAQLESGLGNVSITLLRRVAAAIGRPVEDLVAETDTPDWAEVRELWRRASPEAATRARAILAGGSEPRAEPLLSNRIALIGLRGAGKSTLGRLCAEQLGIRFIEMNKEIEDNAGLSITEVFALYGQEGYRRLEHSAFASIVARPGAMILATAGGIVAEPVTFELLLSSFFTIWIKSSPREHMSRVRNQGDLRPMANDRAAMAELETILSSREPLCARANAVVDTSGLSVQVSLERLFNVVIGERRQPGDLAGALPTETTVAKSFKTPTLQRD